MSLACEIYTESVLTGYFLARGKNRSVSKLKTSFIKQRCILQNLDVNHFEGYRFKDCMAYFSARTCDV